MAYNQNFNRPSQYGGGANREPAPAPAPVTAMKIPANFVDQAEQVMISLDADSRNDPRNKPITSTKIRKLFGLFSDLYNEVKRGDAGELDPEQLQSLTTARVRLVYECGRSGSNSDVAKFVKKAKLLEYLKGVGSSRTEFLKLHQYFEALVAYHRYQFGDDKK